MRGGSAPPTLDAVREQVRLDWVTEQEQSRLEQRVNELRSRYSIEVIGERETP